MAQPVDRRIGDRYRLLSEIGTGGFGKVWKAIDETLNVPVAIWLPAAGSEDEYDERLTRALRESRNAAALRDHPNIPSTTIPPTTDTFDPNSLNNSATDPVPFTAAALLPRRLPMPRVNMRSSPVPRSSPALRRG